MTTFHKTISTKSSRHNRDAKTEDSNTTRCKISIAPDAGDRFGQQGMDQASKLATIAAFELAAAFVRAIPPGCTWCMPHVEAGESWAGGASAFVTFEHDGVEVVIAAIQKVVAQASK